LTEFLKDKAAAEKKYDFNNEIIIDGTISTIAAGKDSCEVKLSGVKPDIRVSFGVPESEGRELRKGRRMHVKGTCSGLTEEGGIKEVGFGGLLVILKDK
jgi:hypothetical protein